MDAQTQTESQPVYTERTTCRACESKTLVSVLDLGVQYLPRFVPEPDETLPKAPIHLVQCPSCGLLQLQHTTAPDLLYRQFWYRSSVNQTMREALANLARSALEFVDEGTWLDIGANDGCLLKNVPDSFTKIGCEPALNFAHALGEHADAVVLDYFSAAAVKAVSESPCDVITSAACFYDVDDPNAFVRDIAECLSPEGVWINQLNDSPTMLQRNAFDSLCHEHLAYYDVPSLARLYRAHGLEINQVTHNEVNGGSVRVFASKQGVRPGLPMLGIPRASFPEAAAFASRVRRWKEQVSSLITESPLFRYTPTWLYGASTKGGTLLQYLDCNDSFLSVADRNPKKFGLRMVGSWVPIVDESTMRKARPKFLFILPWAFADEFTAREADLRASGTTLIYPLPDFRLVM